MGKGSKAGREMNRKTRIVLGLLVPACVAPTATQWLVYPDLEPYGDGGWKGPNSAAKRMGTLVTGVRIPTTSGTPAAFRVHGMQRGCIYVQAWDKGAAVTGDRNAVFGPIAVPAIPNKEIVDHAMVFVDAANPTLHYVPGSVIEASQVSDTTGARTIPLGSTAGMVMGDALDC